MKARFWILAILVTAPSASGAAPRSLEQPGTVVHRQANAHFPEEVGDFRRVEATQYDRDGNDISATYHLNRSDGQLRVTVYVYPAPRVDSASATSATEEAKSRHCDREFDEVRLTIAGRYLRVRPVQDGKAPAIDGFDQRLSRRIVYQVAGRFRGEPDSLRSEVDLYCFVGDRWLVKYRASSNADFDAAPAIEQFIRRGPWPDRAPVADPRHITMRNTEPVPAP